MRWSRRAWPCRAGHGTASRPAETGQGQGNRNGPLPRPRLVGVGGRPGQPGRDRGREGSPAMVSPSRPKDLAKRPRGPVAAAARGALALIAVGALIGLTACGGTVVGDAAHQASAATGSTGPASAGAGGSAGPSAAVTASAGVPLCAAAGKVDRVVAIPPGG